MPEEVQRKVEAFLNPPGMSKKAEQRREMLQMLDEDLDADGRKELQKELDKLTHELEQIPAFELESLRNHLTVTRAELVKLENAPVPSDATAKQAHLAALKKLRAEVLRLEGEVANREADLLREDGGDLTLEISNELYLKSMTEAAQIEQKLTIKMKTLELIELLERQSGSSGSDSAADEEARLLQLDIQQHIADLTQLGAAPNLDALPDRAALQSEVDSTKAVLRDKISEGAFFASEAYQTEGAVEHVVQGMQGGGRLDGVSTWQLLESFNENVGDFMKDMKHYETVDDLHVVAKGFYKSSKYLHRLLDTIKEIKAKFGVADVLPFEKRLLGDAEKVKKQLEDTVLAVRKGAKEFVPEDGEVLTEADIEKRRDEYVLEQLDSLFQSTSLYHLANVVKSLSREVNAWVRTQEMEREAIADREEQRAYFGAM